MTITSTAKSAEELRISLVLSSILSSLANTAANTRVASDVMCSLLSELVRIHRFRNKLPHPFQSHQRAAMVG